MSQNRQVPPIEILAAASYRQITGVNLVAMWPDDLFDAHRCREIQVLLAQLPQPMLCHDNSTDPSFVYANQMAHQVFGYPPGELLGITSRLSAPATNQYARDALLARVAELGIMRGYRGTRIKSDGSLFQISDTDVWNITYQGAHVGQAALIGNWCDNA